MSAYGDNLKISESAFASYTKTLEKEGRRGQASLKGLSLEQQKAMTAGQKFSDGLKSLAKTTASIVGNMAINYAISAALQVAAEAWDDYINKQEKALERGEQAVSKYQENMEKISDASKLIEDSGERFEALQKGIENGVNVSLTTDEYEEYLSLANQIADTFPELVAGYDSLGNPIIEAATSVERLNEALREQQVLLAQETINSAQDIKGAFDAKVSYTATGKNEESGILQKQEFLEFIDSTDEEEVLDRMKYAAGVSSNITGTFADITNAFQDFTAGILGVPIKDLFPNQEGVEESEYYSKRDEALREIMKEAGIENASELEVGTEEWEDALSKIRDLKEQYTNELNSAFNDTKPFIEALMIGDGNYEDLTDATKNAASQIINSLDFSQAAKLGFFGEDGSLDTDAIEDWSENVVAKLSNTDVQDALDKLFALDSTKGDMTFANYKKKANSLINTISSAVPELSKDLLKSVSGFDDSVEDLQGSYQKVFNEIGSDVDKLSNEEIEIAAKIIGLDDFNGDYNDLMDKVYLAKSAIDLDATPLKDAIDDAFEDENPGDIYKDMVSKLETAKELYDKGEIGTNDFKSVAAWLSPTGADDAMNFQENWGKAERYFTEDATGVTNFLKDLEAKELAKSITAIDANGNAIQQWTYNIEDLKDAAQQLGIGFEPMMAMFRRLEDYGFSNNFVGSVEDGVDRIAQKSAELAQAEAELAELTKPGQYETDAGMTVGNQTAIDALREKIARLKQDIGDTTSAMEQLVSQSAEDRIAETEGAKVAIETLREEQRKILNDSSLDTSTKESIAAQIQDQIDAWAQEYHIELDAEANTDEAEKDISQFSAAGIIDPINLELNISNQEDAEQLGQFLSGISTTYNPKIITTIENEAQIDNVVNQLSQIPSNIPANLEFNVQNQEQADALSAKLDEINSKRTAASQITFDVSVVGSETVNSDVDTIEGKQINNKSFDLSFNYFENINQLNTIENLKINDKEYTTTNKLVTKSIFETESSSSGSGKIGWRANGTAHALGTAPSIKAAKFNDGYFGTAHAQGDWGIKQDETALTGELGQEILVRGQHFTTIGDSGPEFVNLKKGDIIFNHRQTKDLLSKGYATGRGKLIGGKSYVTGSAYVDAPGSGYGAIGVGGSGSEAYTSSTDENTAATKENTEAQKTVKDWIEISISRVQRVITNLGKTVSATYKSWTKRNSALTEQQAKVAEEISLQKQAYKGYIKEANSVGLSSKYKKLVQNGTIDIETITDEDLKEKISSYQEFYEKALECKDAIIDLKDELAELARQKFDNVITQYEDKISAIEHEISMLEGQIEQVETAGYFVSASYYEGLVQQEQQNISLLQKEYDALNKALTEAMKTGDISKYSEEWYEMMGDINEVEEALLDANTALIEYQNNIRDLEWEVFDKMQEMLSGIQTESDFLIDLMSNDKMFNEDASITDQGQATLGLHAVNYNSYMSQADDYAKQLLSINKDLANDPYNLELLERREELLEKQRDSILAAEDEKQAIKSLKEDGYNALLDHMDSLIEKRKKLMSDISDLYDYEKSVREQTDEISSLEKQLKAHQGDTSEESRATIQQIKVSLSEARENLEKTEYDKYVSDMSDLYDTLMSDTEEWINTRLESTDELIQGVIDSTNENASAIKETLTNEASAVGTTLSEKMDTIWSSGGTFDAVVSTYQSNFSGLLTTTNSTLDSIRSYVESMVKDSDKTAKKNVSGTSSSSKKSNTTSSSAKKSSTGSSKSSSSNKSGSSSGKWGNWFVSKTDNTAKSKLDKEVSIVDRLKYWDFDSSFSARANYYQAMGFGSSSSYTGSASQNAAMINAMKKNGFSQGGTVGELIKVSGEDGFILARAGESVINEAQMKVLKETLGAVYPVVDGLRQITTPTPVAKNNTYDIQIGDIQMYGVNNPEEFAKQLKYALKNNRDVTRIIQADTLGVMTGKNSLGKYKY